jgi:hypothetical protein
MNKHKANRIQNSIEAVKKGIIESRLNAVKEKNPTLKQSLLLQANNWENHYLPALEANLARVLAKANA